MGWRVRISVCTVLVLTQILVPLCADRSVRVGVFSAPPLVLLQDGKPEGLFIDLIEEFARVGHWNVQYVTGTWPEHLAALEQGRIDLLPAIGFTPERKAIYDFSQDPVFIDSGVLFTAHNAVLHTLFDLRGKRVAALRKSIFTDAFRTNMATFGISFTFVPTDDNQAVMEAIVSGKADAGVCIYSLGNYLAHSYAVTMSPISFSPIALEFATPKGRGAELLSTIDGEMAVMMSDPGSIYSLSYKKWTMPPPSDQFPVWIWWSIAGLAVLGALLGVWNISLNLLVGAQTKKLTDEKERLSVTLKSIADGVITYDAQGTVQLMNPAAERLCGLSQSEAVGANLATVFVLDSTRSGVGSRTHGLSDATLISRDGTRYEIDQASAPILATSGRPIGTVLTFRDITERRKLIESLQRTDKLDALGLVAGGVAHDFNNLLAGIFGYIELARKADIGPKATTYLGKSLGVFQRARALSYQLLTFSRGGAPERKPSDIGQLVRSSAAFAGAGSNVLLSLDLAPELWSCNIDENQIGQVFDNLIINARQAMPAGGWLKIRATNTLGPRLDEGIPITGRLVVVTLEDNGQGIPEDLQNRIFDPFFTTKATGHGLGLAICNSIVRRHEGQLDFVSTPGVGTTFRVILPATEGPAEGAEASALVSHSNSGVVIVLDDEDFLREILSDQLRAFGYSVISAADGQEVLDDALPRAIATGQLRAIFLDLTIPGGMGGRETVLKIRQVLPEIPVIASSGFSDDPIMSDPLSFGFTACIRKPYRADDLALLLNRYVPPFHP